MTVSGDAINSMLDEERMARRTKVMFLRNAGATWSAIAAEVQVSEATCRNDYAVVCRDINGEQPANIVARHRAVIFDIQRANYPAMMRGDKDAAATILKAIDREAKLLGLDAPTRVLAAVSGEEFANEAARLIERINALDPTTLKELERVNRRAPTIIDATVEDPAHDGTPDAAPVDTGSDTGQPGDRRDAESGPVADGAGDERGDQGRTGAPIFDPADWSNIEDE